MASDPRPPRSTASGGRRRREGGLAGRRGRAVVVGAGGGSSGAEIGDPPSARKGGRVRGPPSDKPAGPGTSSWAALLGPLCGPRTRERAAKP
jgi:hypothetical protein